MSYKAEKLEYANFPDKLKNIEKPPKELYLIGNKKLLWEDCFGVIGTRKITEYGIENCKHFTKELVLRDIPIVSGMAIGTDSVAHKTTLDYRGKTIAVLGSGFNYISPAENKKLFREIIENDGLIVTEYEENIKPYKDNFPKRNRIITALSEGILVVEAAYRSGTSITARNTKKQGKNVFALPGRLDSKVGVGVNRLIKEGAILTTDIDDILKFYPQFNNRLRKKEIINNAKSVNIKEEYKTIYNAIKEGKSYFEEILSSGEMNFKDTMKQLSYMEIEGIIKQDITGKYSII